MSGLILEIMKILVDLGKNLEVYGFTWQVKPKSHQHFPEHIILFFFSETKWHKATHPQYECVLLYHNANDRLILLSIWRLLSLPGAQRGWQDIRAKVRQSFVMSLSCSQLLADLSLSPPIKENNLLFQAFFIEANILICFSINWMNHELPEWNCWGLLDDKSFICFIGAWRQWPWLALYAAVFYSSPSLPVSIHPSPYFSNLPCACVSVQVKSAVEGLMTSERERVGN